MYTGIIQEVAVISGVDKVGDWTFTICAPLTTQELAIGASVACNGICLTVTKILDDSFCVQASTETLDKTCCRNWDIDTDVNIERSLRVGDELGGHLVFGHIDGIAKIVSRSEEEDSIRFILKVPEEFLPFLAPKGSITLDGISLTINDVKEDYFGVNIIPHTQKATNIALRQAGDCLNFEVDMLARYVASMLDHRQS